MSRSRGYSTRGASEAQDRLLKQIFDRARDGNVGTFDLDGCLLDFRTRQVDIFVDMILNLR